MIHEKLHGANSGSMPELQTRNSNPKKHNERSVDEVPLPTPRASVQHNVPPPVRQNAPAVPSIESPIRNFKTTSVQIEVPPASAQNVPPASAKNVPPPTTQRSLPLAQNGFEDPDEEMTVFEFVRGLSVLEAKEDASGGALNEVTEKPVSTSSKNIPEQPEPTEDFQKRVKFEKVNEIQETFYEVHVDEAFGESSSDEPFGESSTSQHFGQSSTDEPFGYQEASSPMTPDMDLPPPTPMKRKSRENISEHVDDKALPSSEPIFERVSVDYKHLKVESRDDSDNEPIVVEIPFNEVPAAEARNSEPDGCIGQIPDIELPIAAELNAVLETMPPLVKPRTKKTVERTSDVGKVEEVDHVQETAQRLPPEKPERAPVVSFAQEDFPAQKKLPEVVQQKLPSEATPADDGSFKTSPNRDDSIDDTQEFFVSNKFSENYENFSHEDENFSNQDSRFIYDDSDSSSEDRVSPPIENSHIVPKSILKTSDTTGGQKSITFHNVPDSSSSSSESFFSDEEQDVWSQVDQQRFHLSRNRMPDTPPPLPKTPPPTAEEESRFSYA